MRPIIFWLLIVCACALAAKPVGSAARRTISAAQAGALWQAARTSDRSFPKVNEPAIWLRIPSIRFGQPALQGVTKDNLERFPCVVAWPGSPANGPALTVILGHRDTHFRSLERLSKNASLTVTRRNGSQENYRVTAIEILDPDTAQKMIESRRNQTGLVLMTCHPFRFIGPAPKRILFWASPVQDSDE